MLFWNTGGLGWSIGKAEYLESGNHWHRSGLDTEEPWQGAWQEGAVVECAGAGDTQQQECQVRLDSEICDS